MGQAQRSCWARQYLSEDVGYQLRNDEGSIDEPRITCGLPWSARASVVRATSSSSLRSRTLSMQRVDAGGVSKGGQWKKMPPMTRAEAATKISAAFRGSLARCRVASMMLQRYKQVLGTSESLGSFRNMFIVVANRSDCDANWASRDPRWVGFASMSERHNILLRYCRHWHWCNVLIFGMNGGSYLDRAIRELERMHEGASTFAKRQGVPPLEESDIGMYFHSFGLNIHYCLIMHLVDLRTVGPSYLALQRKNLALLDVLQVLRQELFGLINKDDPQSSTRSLSDGCDLKVQMGRWHPTVNDKKHLRISSFLLACSWWRGSPPCVLATFGILDERRRAPRHSDQALQCLCACCVAVREAQEDEELKDSNQSDKQFQRRCKE